MAILRVKNLTRGEKLYLYRRREGKTQFQMAVDYGVCMSEYRAMEFDEEKAPYMTLGEIEPHEVCSILRRRKGLTKTELAEKVGVSSYWLGQMEAGKAPLAKLQKFWEKRQ